MFYAEKKSEEFSKGDLSSHLVPWSTYGDHAKSAETQTGPVS